jgi:ribonuclease T2
MRTGILFSVLLAAAAMTATAQRRQAPSTPGKFDYYLLSLSWSPQYCTDMGDDPEDPQCAPGRRYGFVVHGLWPQNQVGDSPRTCSPAPRLDPQTANSMLDVMPSQQLVLHEWGSHGTCSGLQPGDFFKLTRAAFQKVIIPARYRGPSASLTVPVKQFRQSLVDANPGLKPEDFAIYCDDTFLREVRVCLDKNLRFRACGIRVHDACRIDAMLLRAVK